MIKLINLGCMNGWTEDPPEYKDHMLYCAEYKPSQGSNERIVFKTYPVTEAKIGNCYYRYTCPKCGITYSVDSSG